MKSGARGVCDGLGEQVLPARDAVREELLVCCIERLQLLICYLHDKGRCDVQDDHRGLEVDCGTRIDEGLELAGIQGMGAASLYLDDRPFPGVRPGQAGTPQNHAKT